MVVVFFLLSLSLSHSVSLTKVVSGMAMNHGAEDHARVPAGIEVQWPVVKQRAPAAKYIFFA